MKLCAEQMAFITLIILVVICIVAFLSGFFNVGGFISNLISGGFITCFEYLFLKQRSINMEKDKMINAKKTFLEWFYFFPKKWSSYKELIESGNLREPEINQPNTIADQITSSFIGVQATGFKFTPKTKEKIETTIEDLHKFGFDLRTRMQLSTPTETRFFEVIEGFLRRGETITKSIEDLSEDLEKSLEIK